MIRWVFSVLAGLALSVLVVTVGQPSRPHLGPVTPVTAGPPIPWSAP